ncbi:MAG: hypothetical protein PSV16_11745 [Flavobacterium sp.]|nr:hypothetical protein [Flavobacterium sp.]
MKKISTYILLSLSIAFISCKKEPETPKVIYEDASKTQPKPVKVDSSQIKIADLPIQMEGTKYLIHPIGDFRIYEGRSKTGYGSSNTDKVSFSISNYNRFEITGYLQNLKFQHIDSTEIRPLTNENVIIQTASYLNTVFDKTKQQFMVYAVIDMDTNKDGKLDSNDIKALYISEISGKRFTKLSIDFQELIDWNLVESKNRLYFRSIEDTNKNGQFDKDDFVHYHFVNLTSKDWKVEDYDPIK